MDAKYSQSSKRQEQARNHSTKRLDCRRVPHDSDHGCRRLGNTRLQQEQDGDSPGSWSSVSRGDGRLSRRGSHLLSKAKTIWIAADRICPSTPYHLHRVHQPANGFLGVLRAILRRCITPDLRLLWFRQPHWSMHVARPLIHRLYINAFL